MSIIHGTVVKDYLIKGDLGCKVGLVRGNTKPVLVRDPVFYRQDGSQIVIPMEFAVIAELDSDISVSIKCFCKAGFKYSLRTDKELISGAYYSRREFEADKSVPPGWVFGTIDRFEDGYRIKVSTYTKPQPGGGDYDPAYVMTLEVYEMLDYERVVSEPKIVSGRTHGTQLYTVSNHDTDGGIADVKKGSLQKGEPVLPPHRGTIENISLSENLQKMTFCIFTLKDLDQGNPNSELNRKFKLLHISDQDDLD